MASFLAIGKEDRWFFLFIWRRRQHGMMARGMEAQNHFGPSGMFDAEALRTDGNTAVGADFDGGADAPNIRPPSTSGGWAQDRSFFFLGSVPGFLRSHAQFAMGFVEVAMKP